MGIGPLHSMPVKGSKANVTFAYSKGDQNGVSGGQLFAESGFVSATNPRNTRVYK